MATDLVSQRFRLSRTKTKYLECEFSDITHVEDVEVRIDTLVISKREFQVSGVNNLKEMGRLTRILHIILQRVDEMEARTRCLV